MMANNRFLGVFTLFLMFQSVSYGQLLGANFTQEEPLIYIEGFNYPTFERYTHYGWFRVNFGVTPTTELSVGGEHYRNLLADRFALAFELRQYISKKTFLIGGHEMEWDLLNKGSGKPDPIPINEVYFGIGQDVSPSILMEAKLVQPLGDQRFYKVGLEGVRTRLEVGTRIKF